MKVGFPTKALARLSRNQKGKEEITTKDTKNTKEEQQIYKKIVSELRVLRALRGE
jgi:hypothetical protein